MDGEPRWGRGWISLGVWLALEVGAFGLLVVACVALPALWASSTLLLALGPHVVGLFWLLALERGRLRDPLRPSARAVAWGLGGAVGMILVGGGWTMFLEAAGAAPPDMAGYLRDLMPSPALLFGWGALLVPIVEEGWFRGRLLEAVRGRLDARWAFLISSVLFTAVHGIPVLFPAYFALAAILFLLRERTGGLVAPIVAHAVNNLWGLLVA